MTFEEHLTLIDERATAFRAVAASAPDLDARVPSCPAWSLRDLVAHLGEVHRFWAAAATSSRPGEEPAEVGETTPHGDLIEWSAESARLLIDALRAAGPDRPVWTWWPGTGAPETSGAVARHQVQEAAVHLYDAQLSVGKPEPVPAAIAVDSIDEYTVVTFGANFSYTPWPHRPARLTLAATEGPTWTVDLTPGGVQTSPAASGDPLATLHGSASDLLLTLFGRIPLSEAHVDGDREAVDQVLTWLNND